MISLAPVVPEDRPLRVLVLGAHCDDFEIGCGGTILRLKERDGGLDAHVHLFSADDDREREARGAAGALLDGSRRASVEVDRFRENYFPWSGEAIKERVAEIGRDIDPDIVLTHSRHDRHQDHRVLSDLAWNTFRDHLILEYEIPKWDGDLETPNLYVPLTGDQVDSKLAILATHFPSQASTKPWFDPETFRGLMRLRGVECGADSGYAEGFHARKAVL